MPGGRRTANKDLAAASLAGGKTIAEAATAAGVHQRTVYAWKAEDAEFRARVAQLRAEMVSSALGKLSDGMTTAADALVALLGNADPDVRHRAAVKVIELALRVRNESEIEERFAAVEEQLRNTDGEQDRGATEGGGEDRGAEGSGDV